MYRNGLAEFLIYPYRLKNTGGVYPLDYGEGFFTPRLNSVLPKLNGIKLDPGEGEIRWKEKGRGGQDVMNQGADEPQTLWYRVVELFERVKQGDVL